MSIPNLQIVLKTIRENYNCSLTTIKGKRIMFEGVSNNKKLVLCTPSSKLHSQGKGWCSCQVFLNKFAQIIFNT